MTEPSGRSSRRQRGLWIVGWSLLAIPMLLTALRERHGPWQEVLGSAIGTAAFGLVLASVGFFIWVRLIEKRREFFGPPVLMVAAGISLFGFMGQAGREAEERDDENAAFTADAMDCSATRLRPFPPLGRRLRYEPPSRRMRSGLDVMATAMQVDGELLRGKELRSGRTPVGGVIAIPGIMTDEDAADVLEGARAATVEQGVQASSVEIAGRPGLIRPDVHGVTLMTSDGRCYAYAVAATDERSAITIARKLIGEPSR